MQESPLNFYKMVLYPASMLKSLKLVLYLMLLDFLYYRIIFSVNENLFSFFLILSYLIFLFYCTDEDFQNVIK